MPQVYLSVPDRILKIIDRVIQREGGYVDHPDDPGGATNMGITFKVLQRWRGVSITKQDVMNIPKEEAIQIYYQWYWEKLRLHHLGIDWWLREMIFDWAVNAGLRNPVRHIQRLVGVKSDGIIGPVTSRAISRWKSRQGIRAHGYLVDCRVRWYIRLVESRHTRITFMEGWFNRANHMRYSGEPYERNA